MNFDKLRHQVVVGSHKVPTGAVQSTKCLCVSVRLYSPESHPASMSDWSGAYLLARCRARVQRVSVNHQNAKRLPLSTVRNVPPSTTSALCTPLCHAQFIHSHEEWRRVVCVLDSHSLARLTEELQLLIQLKEVFFPSSRRISGAKSLDTSQWFCITASNPMHTNHTASLNKLSSFFYTRVEKKFRRNLWKVKKYWCVDKRVFVA